MGDGKALGAPVTTPDRTIISTDARQSAGFRIGDIHDPGYCHHHMESDCSAIDAVPGPLEDCGPVLSVGRAPDGRRQPAHKPGHVKNVDGAL